MRTLPICDIHEAGFLREFRYGGQTNPNRMISDL